MNQQIFCHDCGKEIEVNSDGELLNGHFLKYDLGNGKFKEIFKCSECFNQNKGLNNFQETEVYSRVVGYLRPVSQWNEGKQQEFKDRKEFKVN